MFVIEKDVCLPIEIITFCTKTMPGDRFQSIEKLKSLGDFSVPLILNQLHFVSVSIGRSTYEVRSCDSSCYSCMMFKYHEESVNFKP